MTTRTPSPLRVVLRKSESLLAISEFWSRTRTVIRWGWVTAVIVGTVVGILFALFMGELGEVTCISVSSWECPPSW